MSAANACIAATLQSLLDKNLNKLLQSLLNNNHK